MDFLRNAFERLADAFDRVREPGWIRNVAIIVFVTLVMLIPYPLSVTGDFEMVSSNPVMARNMVKGTVIEVPVRMNDEVEVDQVVARLMDAEKKHALAQVDAELAEANALLRLKESGYRKEEIEIVRYRVQELRAIERLAKLEHKRQKALLKERAVAESEVDLARSKHLQAQKVLSQGKQELNRLTNGFRTEDIEQAAAKVDQLNAMRDEILEQIEWTEVRSPKAGRIVTSNEDLQKLVGQHLEQGTELMMIVSPNELVARVRIGESDFGEINLDQEVLLRPYQYPSIEFKGSVDSIQPVVVSDDEFSSSISLMTRADDPKWELLTLNSSGKAKVVLPSRAFGLVVYRRVVRSLWVQAWSWY